MSGVSPNTTTMSSAPCSMAGFAARTHARCRGALSARTPVNRRSSRAHRPKTSSCSGADYDCYRVLSVMFSAVRTCPAASGRPPLCSTFGARIASSLPSPAASTIVRAGSPAHFDSLQVAAVSRMRRQGHVRDELLTFFNNVIRGPGADNEARLGQNENGRGIGAGTSQIQDAGSVAIGRLGPFCHGRADPGGLCRDDRTRP